MIQGGPTFAGKFAKFIIKNARLAFLAMAIVLVYGLGFAYPSLPRQSFPDIEMPQGSVSIGYPGASPTEVENLITKKVETKVRKIAEVDTLESWSQEGFASISVTFEAGSDLDLSLIHI